mmetsp:Transcript_59060/g.175695  ORF Transcript_59060/g.175695 Transcript_59060/m.175695 type:complete len:213 (-) Transcript_59060:79-717(-)
MPPSDMRVSQIKRRFKKLDGNRDGSLSFAEMSRLLRSGRSDLSDKELQLLFDNVDKNGNGRIEFGEFVDFVFDASDVGRPAEQRGSVPAARRRQSWDHVAEANDISWEQLKDTFLAYAGRNQLLEGSEFSRMCRDCGLYDESFGSPDADTVFAYVVSRGHRHMGPKQFQAALELIAERKACPTVAVRAVVAHARGPVLTATKAQDVRFYRSP